MKNGCDHFPWQVLTLIKQHLLFKTLDISMSCNHFKHYSITNFFIYNGKIRKFIKVSKNFFVRWDFIPDILTKNKKGLASIDFIFSSNISGISPIYAFHRRWKQKYEKEDIISIIYSKSLL